MSKFTPLGQVSWIDQKVQRRSKCLMSIIRHHPQLNCDSCSAMLVQFCQFCEAARFRQSKWDDIRIPEKPSVMSNQISPSIRQDLVTTLKKILNKLSPYAIFFFFVLTSNPRFEDRLSGYNLSKVNTKGLDLVNYRIVKLLIILAGINHKIVWFILFYFFAIKCKLSCKWLPLSPAEPSW